MPKMRYLTKDKAGWKLRRNVPANLQDVAGKTAWVERVTHSRSAKLKEQAATFAVRTNTELRRLSALLDQSDPYSKQTVSNEPGFIKGFDITDIEQIALAYFYQLERNTSDAGGFLSDPENDRFQERLIDAYMDEADAASISAGGTINPDQMSGTASHNNVLKLLINYGYISRSYVFQPDPQSRPGERWVAPVEILVNPNFKKLCDLIERADHEHAARSVKALETGRYPNIEDHFFLPPNINGFGDAQHSNSSQLDVADLLKAFREQKELKGVGVSRMSQFSVPMRAISETLGEDCLLNKIGRVDCDAIAELLVKVPAYATQHYKGMTLNQAAEAYKAKSGNYSRRFDEARKSMTIVSAVFKFGVSKEWMFRDPAELVEIIGQDKDIKFHELGTGYEPFEIEELRKIFSAPLYVGCKNDEGGFGISGPNIVLRHRYWAPLVALWTGMRMNEILQLERGDIRQSDGIWYLSVTDEAEIVYDPSTFVKQVKNQNAIRDIPIHPELIRLGFVSWTQMTERGRLFPEAIQGVSQKPSIPFSKRMATFLKSLDVWAPRRKVFHSFRNNFNDALRDGGVNEEMRENINGWKRQKSMDRKYGRGEKVQRLHSELSKAVYEGLDLSHLYRE